MKSRKTKKGKEGNGFFINFFRCRTHLYGEKKNDKKAVKFAAFFRFTRFQLPNLGLYTVTKKLAGILGLSFIISDSEIFYPNTNDLVLTSFELNHLTRREKECAYWLVRGYTQKQIARTLKISPRTVEHYLEAVKDKLDCNNRAQLIEKIASFTRNQNVFLNKTSL